MTKNNRQYKRAALIDSEPIEREIVFNPTANQWYYWSYTIPDTLPTRQGPVRMDSLTEKKTAVVFVAFDIAHMTSYDLIFMKNEEGHIAIFTMVDTASEMGSFWRTDRGGFNYKDAYLYFNSLTSPLEEASHYLATENLKGEWAVIELIQNKKRYPNAYNEFTTRKLLVSGCKTKEEALNQLNMTCGGLDPLDKSRFIEYHIADYK